MKKTLSLLLALAMCLSLAACGGDGSKSNADAKSDAGANSNAGDNFDAGDNSVADSSTEEALKIMADLYAVVDPLYTEVAQTADANGWLDDETTVLELTTTGDLLDTASEMLQDDPSVLEGIDLGSMCASLEQLKPALEEMLERVSVPYEG